MMGSRDKPQDELFYAFNLDEIVPQDYVLRDIDRGLDLSNLREHLAPFYSHTGRPSIDPELMIRMLLIGHCCGIRLERQLCYEVTMNLGHVRQHPKVFQCLKMFPTPIVVEAKDVSLSALLSERGEGVEKKILNGLNAAETTRFSKMISTPYCSKLTLDFAA